MAPEEGQQRGSPEVEAAGGAGTHEQQAGTLFLLHPDGAAATRLSIPKGLNP